MGRILGIYGAGGLGREVLELASIINRKGNQWDGFLFVVDGQAQASVNGVDVYSYEAAKEKYQGRLAMAIGIGEPAVREKIFDKLKKDGIDMPSLAHPDVYIPDTARIGSGVAINMGCFVSCNVRIGDNSYIQPHSNIGHDCVLEEGCMLSGFSNLAGGVRIGKYTYIGLGSCIKEGVSIGNHTIVGMASAVFKDLPDGVIALGNPARPMRKNEERIVFKH